MDTSSRIAWLCDGDKRLIYGDLDGHYLSLEYIQFEYWAYEVGVNMGIAADAVRELGRSLLDEIPLSSLASLNAYNDMLDGMYFPERPAKWKSIKELGLKHKTIRPLSRQRCRWRARESRHTLRGLSPNFVIIDEYAFAEEGSCKY